MPDIILNCKDCGNNFTFTEKDQEFFEKMQFTQPRRCKSCRLKKKENKR